MRQKFFKSQKECAAVLGIPISKLRQLKKAQECPAAFKSGRIYRGPLEKFLAIDKSRAAAAIEQTLAGLNACRKLEILDEVQYLEFAKTIVEQSGDPAILNRWFQEYVGECLRL
jgi:hypothetical protein